MADCELLKKCPFFNDKMEDMPTIAEQMKNRYCRSDNSRCARYMVFKAMGREKVPTNLTPNQFARALKIIEEG